jgi:hypothetical protein
MRGAFPAIRQQVFGVKHHQPDRHQDARQPQAESYQQNQTEPDAAERDRAQQQHERRRAGHQTAARAQCDQASQAYLVRHVAVDVPVAMVVHQAAVMMMFMRLVSVIVRMALVRMLVARAMKMRVRVFVYMSMSMLVVVRVGVVVMVVRRQPSSGPDPLVEQNRADPHDRDARNHTQHRKDLLGQHVARKKERCQPE